MLIPAVCRMNSFVSAYMQSSTCIENGGACLLPSALRTPGFKVSICALSGGLLEIGSAIDIWDVYGFARFIVLFASWVQRNCAHCWRATAIASKFEGEKQFPKFCPVQNPRTACSGEVKPHIATIDGLFFTHLKALVTSSSPRRISSSGYVIRRL